MSTDWLILFTFTTQKMEKSLTENFIFRTVFALDDRRIFSHSLRIYFRHILCSFFMMARQHQLSWWTSCKRTVYLLFFLIWFSCLDCKYLFFDLNNIKWRLFGLLSEPISFQESSFFFIQWKVESKRTGYPWKLNRLKFNRKHFYSN